MASKGHVLITGASSGIGEACALHMDELGYEVFAGVRRACDGEALRQKAPDALTPILLDVTDGDSIAHAAEVVGEAVNGVGLAGLVNNAGIAVAGPLEVVPLAAFRRQFDVNVFGQLAVTQAFLPLLREGGGRVINMGSISGRLAGPMLGPYAASKFALEALTDSLRLELQSWGIPVSIIEPGSVATPIWARSATTTKDVMAEVTEPGRALYRPLVTAMGHVTDEAARQAIPAQRVADVVARALAARRPKARYLVGRDAKLAALLLSPLPDRVRDWLILKSVWRRRS